ncbi:MAG: cation diffusion facilitator family transporter [Deltaproteobacteria bacterium]
MTDRKTKKIRVALLSVASNTVLVGAKFAVGIVIGSVSVISEAIHSGVDLVAAIIALYAVKNSGTPADERHPYGHGKIENISGAIEALLIFLAAGWIIYEAINKIFHPEPMNNALWGVFVMFVSAIINIIVSQKLFNVGRETDSVALIADGWHLRTDVYTSAGVSLALIIIWIGAKFIPSVDLRWLDPAVAILVALMIIKAAYKLTIEATRDLLDANLPSDEVQLVKKTIETHYPTIKGYHQLRTRKAGNFRFIEFHIKVTPTMSVAESHKISQNLIAEINNTLADTNTTIHIEPCDGNCTDRCLSGCLLPTQEQGIETCATIRPPKNN